MAISASATATGLVRISIVLAYCFTVVALFFLTRHFQGNKMAPATSSLDGPSLNLTARSGNGVGGGHAGRGVGRWAKIRRGGYISAVRNEETGPGVKKSPEGNSQMIVGKTAGEKKEMKDGKKDNVPQKSNLKTLDKKISDAVKEAKDAVDKQPPAPKLLSAPKKDNVKVTSKLTPPPSPSAKKPPQSVPAVQKPMPSVQKTESIQSNPKSPTGAPNASGTPYISPDRKKRFPDCLIIGARKAGTRPLLRFMRLHPQIKGVGNEVTFFSDPVNYAKGLDWYLEQMPPTRPDKVLVEKSAEYFHSREAPLRVYSMKPSMKLILVVRDPFERLVSDYYFLQRFAAMTNSTYPFAELTHSLEELCFNRTTGKISNYGGLIRSRYVKHTEHWLRWFRRDQLHIVDGDAFSRNNPATELRRVEHFLQLQPYFTPDAFYMNVTKGYYCARATGCLEDEKGHTHPTFSPSFVHSIRTHFQPYNERFYDLVGFNFMWATSYT